MKRKVKLYLGEQPEQPKQKIGSMYRLISTEHLHKVASTMNSQRRNSTKPLEEEGHHHELNGYRILTIQNTVGKLMEGTVARKLARDLEDREILPENRGRGGGGRPGKCSWERV